MEMNKLGILLSAFITIIIGLVLIGSLADSIFLTTNTVSVSDPTTITEAGLNAGTLVNLDNDDIINTSVTVDNGTTVINPGNYTVYPSDGQIAVFNNTEATWVYGLSLNVNYTYKPDEYIANATSRTLVSLIIIFFALAVLAIGFVLIRRMGLF